MTRILVIDDERSIRSTLKEILEFEKYKVDTAQDAPEALEYVKNNNYDLIFSDIKMPNIDGIELLRPFLKMGIEAPIVMISGHVIIETAVECIKDGACDYMT